MSGWSVAGRGGHVAETVVGEAREPSIGEAGHLESCPACFAAVRRGTSFERQLAVAVAALPSPSIPPEVLTMSMPSIRRPPTPSLTSLGVIAALVVAAGLVTWSVLPRAEAGASASVIPIASSDPHTVVVGDAQIAVRLDGRVISIRSSIGHGPLDTLVSVDVGNAIDGNFGYALRCPARPDRPLLRAVFGRITPNVGEEAPPVTYTGPPADGQAASDGLFLYVLKVDASAAPAAIRVENVHGALGFGTGAFDADPAVVAESSGCFLIG